MMIIIMKRVDIRDVSISGDHKSQHASFVHIYKSSDGNDV